MSRVVAYPSIHTRNSFASTEDSIKDPRVEPGLDVAEPDGSPKPLHNREDT